MARELQVKIWCDPCATQDLRTEGVETPLVTIGGNKPRMVALCEPHRKELYDPFAEIITNLGVTMDQIESNRAPKRVKAKSGSDAPPPSQMPGSSTGKAIKCPLGDCDETRKSPSGVADHLRKHHSTTMYDAIGPDGQLYDVDGDPVDTPKPRRYAASA